MSLKDTGPSFEGVEEILLGEESDEEWLHFVSRSTPDFMYEHWQNFYEARMEIQEYKEKREEEILEKMEEKER